VAVACTPLRLSFLDDPTAFIDLRGLSWVGVFAELAEPVYFAHVELDPVMGTVVWPNGTDIAAEYLYDAAVASMGSVATG